MRQEKIRMTTAPAPLLQARAMSAKHVGFAVLGLLTLLVIYYDERFLINPSDPLWEHFRPVRWWLLFHGVGGALALFLGPIQFSTRFRQRYLRAHRIMGRIYVAGVLVSAPIGVYITIAQGMTFMLSAAVVQATGWLLTTAVAVVCARRGNIQQHRLWMARSYAITFVFVAGRAILLIPPIERMGDDGVRHVVWICIAAAFLLPDFIINWRVLFSRKPSRAVRPAPEAEMLRS
jgi:uncharacterized membrane protein